MHILDQENSTISGQIRRTSVSVDRKVNLICYIYYNIIIIIMEIDIRRSLTSLDCIVVYV